LLAIAVQMGLQICPVLRTCTGSVQPNMGSFHIVQYLLSK
jgi:hypothetical protein